MFQAYKSPTVRTDKAQNLVINNYILMLDVFTNTRCRNEGYNFKMPNAYLTLYQRNATRVP